MLYAQEASRTRQSSFSAFRIDEEFLISHQMPHAKGPVLFNGNDSQQTEAALVERSNHRPGQTVHPFKSPAAQINREPASAVIEFVAKRGNAKQSTQQGQFDSKKNYYEVLGADDGASRRDIERLYRRLAHRRHPDRGGSRANESVERSLRCAAR